MARLLLWVMANPGPQRSYPMFDEIYNDDATALDLELDLNEPDEIDGLILSQRDGDGCEVYRFN